MPERPLVRTFLDVQTPYILVISMFALSGLMMTVERAGAAPAPMLWFKGDLKRETRFVAQYGQFLCALITILLIWQLDAVNGSRVCKAMWASWLGGVLASTFIKKLVGRVRPRGEKAGKFLGPSLRHANYCESFPSNHSASAAAYGGVLAAAYPHAAITFWTLAVCCAVLRYLMDAHWPSDVLAGVALGYLASIISCKMFLGPL